MVHEFRHALGLPDSRYDDVTDVWFLLCFSKIHNSMSLKRTAFKIVPMAAS